jgi:hypothetical protein
MATHTLNENCSLAFAAPHAFKPFRTSVPNSVLEQFLRRIEQAACDLLSTGAEFEF